MISAIDSQVQFSRDVSNRDGDKMLADVRLMQLCNKCNVTQNGRGDIQFRLSFDLLAGLSLLYAAKKNFKSLPFSRLRSHFFFASQFRCFDSQIPFVRTLKMTSQPLGIERNEKLPWPVDLCLLFNENSVLLKFHISFVAILCRKKSIDLN